MKNFKIVDGVLYVTVLSLFDGISCGRIALEKVKSDLCIKFGVKKVVFIYYASEVKEVAIKCSKDNYSDIIQIGDVTKVSYKDGVLKTEKGIFNVGKIDLLIGGSPCQDFSNANINKLGLDGPKSKLFYHYHRILKEVNPSYFLLENVKMKQDQQNILNLYMGCEPIYINSSLVCGAMRKRLYWTNIPVVGLPKDKNIKLQDILTDGYTPKQKAFCLMEGDSRPLATPVKMFHRWYAKSFNNLVFKNKEHYLACKKHYDKNFKGLSATKIGAKIIEDNIDVSVYDGVRYLNKGERVALQTLPKEYCKCLSLNNTAGCCGDGWTVDVIAHILGGLKNENRTM